jgi:hypothetical protein
MGWWVAKRKSTEQDKKLTLDRLIAQTKPQSLSYSLSDPTFPPPRRKPPRPLSFEDLDRLSKLEDLDRMLWKIQEIERISPKIVSPDSANRRMLTEEHFQWLIDLAQNKYEIMREAVEAEYPSKR